MNALARTLIPALLAVPFLPVWAQERQIEQVTVYPDRAEVVRLVEMNVQAGEHQLEITDLPIHMNPDSLRVTPGGLDGVAIGGVELRQIRGADRVQPRARELEATIRDMDVELQRLANRIEARNLQIRLLSSAAAGGGESAPTSSEQLDLLDRLGTSAEAVLDQRLEHETERDRLQRERERLQRELQDLGQTQRDTRQALIDYRSERAGRIQLTLRYEVSQASWEPFYEWRLLTDEGRMTLIQRAQVRQNTGEDWTNAIIRVALGRPAQGGRLPELSPWYIDVHRPREREIAAEAMAFDRAAPMASRPDQALLEGTEMAAEFRIPGRSTLTGDGATRRFVLAEHQLEAKVSARTVPRRQARAWLFAVAEYNGEAWLPPGRVSLFQDGSLVGQTGFAGLAPGGSIEASFGVAERIEVSYRMVRDTRGSEGVIRRQNRMERVFDVGIVNRYSRPLEILVIDQMPVARDERIEVAMTSASRKPDYLEFNGQPGVVAWRDVYEPAQERAFQFGYQATFPRDIDGLSGW